MQTIGERLKWARQEAGYDSAADASRSFGWTRTTYNDHENGHRQPKLAMLKRYASAFSVPWVWLQEGGPPPDKRRRGAAEKVSRFVGPGMIPTTGEVAAGQWLDVDVEMDPDDFDQHPIAAHPDYPVSAQYGLIVKGNSMNRVFPAGVVLHCVDVIKADLEPLEDDIVIVQRTRAQAGQREVTAKRINRRGKMIVLSPDSTEPQWRPIEFDPKGGHDGEEEVRVLALVIGRYTPMRRRRA